MKVLELLCSLSLVSQIRILDSYIHAPVECSGYQHKEQMWFLIVCLNIVGRLSEFKLLNISVMCLVTELRFSPQSVRVHRSAAGRSVGVAGDTVCAYASSKHIQSSRILLQSRTLTLSDCQKAFFCPSLSVFVVVELLEASRGIKTSNIRFVNSETGL